MPRLPALDAQFAGTQDVLLRTLAASPAIASSALAHAHAVMDAGAVPSLTKELCAVMVAGIGFCRPALVAHRKRARRAGASADMLSALWNYARSDCFTAAQKAALDAAVALTREPRGLPETIWGALRDHYDDAQIVELLCAVGLANYFDRVSNALLV